MKRAHALTTDQSITEPGPDEAMSPNPIVTISRAATRVAMSASRRSPFAILSA
jgi:hypothetical protein